MTLAPAAQAAPGPPGGGPGAGVIIRDSWGRISHCDDAARRLLGPLLATGADDAWDGLPAGTHRVDDDRWVDVAEASLADGATLTMVMDCTVRERDRQAAQSRMEEAERAHALLASLTRLQGHLLMTGDETGVYAATLETALEITNSEFGFVAEVFTDSATGRPYLLSRALSDIAWNAEARRSYERSRSAGLRFDNLDTLFGQVLLTRDVVVANDPASDPRSGGLPQGHPRLVNFLGLPVTIDGILIGSVGLANRPGGYDEALVDAMDPFLRACGTLLRHSRFERARRRAEEELRGARTRAESASAAKNIFLSRMSHEIRTPLNAMLGFAQLIQIRASDDKDRRDAGRIVSAGRHLMTLLDEVMDVSSIEEGRIPLDLSPLSLVEFTSECLTIIEGAAVERSISLSLVVDTEVAGDLVTVYVDPSRLRQVILNLLDNAVKYNRHGGSVRVRIEIIDDTAILDIEDEGRGISEEGRERAFDVFERLDAAAIGVRGSGLGLSVARSLARAMAGDVRLASSRPGMTVFRLLLPVTDLDTRSKSAPEPEFESLDVSGEVLYVEDNATNAVLVRSVLEHLLPAVRLTLARSGHEALGLLARSTPDLILLDLHLTDMSGFDLLRRSGVIGRVPVHAVTADVTLETRRRMVEAGIDRVLLKPVTPRDLVSSVVETLEGRPGRAEGQLAAPASPDIR